MRYAARTGRFAPDPATSALYLCYVAFPAAAIVFRLTSEGVYFRQWLDAVWVFLTVLLASVLASPRRSLSAREWVMLFAPLAAFSLIVIRLLAGAAQGMSIEASVLVIEFKLLLYAVLAALIIALAGSPSARAWQRAGFWLGVVVVIDTVAETLKNGVWSRPQGAGEVNYEAMLLAVSLAFSLYIKLDTRIERIKYVLVPLVALVLTQSRTMVLASFVMYFMLSRSHRLWRIFALVIGLSVSLALFNTRSLELSPDSIDRYWMWVAGMEVLRDPSAFLAGGPPGVPLSINVPAAVFDLWQQQTASLVKPGVYPFNFHAFWLRFAITFGVPAMSAVLWYSLYKLFSRRAPTAERHLYGLFALASCTMGSLYLSNVGVPLLLAFHAARKFRRAPR